MTNSETYLKSVLSYHQVGDLSAYRDELNLLYEVLQEWADTCFQDIILSGSLAKKTAIYPSSDLDIVVSLSSRCNESNGGLKGINTSFVNYLRLIYPDLRNQNVSVGLNFSGLKVDVTPARKVPNFTHKHFIYSTKKQSYVQTNVQQHVSDVSESGRTDEIKLIKIWREKNKLEFPSIYMEYLLINQILKYKSLSDLAGNMEHIFNELAKEVSNPLLNSRIVDPSNSSNVLSGLMTVAEKRKVVEAAQIASWESCWTKIFS